MQTAKAQIRLCAHAIRPVPFLLIDIVYSIRELLEKELQHQKETYICQENL